MIKLKENHLAWALKHIQKYYHSDFYPKIFEFSAIAHNWQSVKDYILSLDIDTYQPKSPMINLAPKTDGNYRIVHQLEPIDSLIYTALIHEVCETIEDYRIPASECIACSYRTKPDLEGSFFSRDTGWNTFQSKSETLVGKYKTGFVIIADITDFYNQIYTHRINNLIEIAGKGVFKEQARVIEEFLLGLNKRTSRGIPVGPVPSIILAELIMSDIDNKIRTFTDDFVRYVDDIRIFFERREDAVYTLHELTQYLYSSHRLVFSGRKTVVQTVKWFSDKYLIDEEAEEKLALTIKADELATTEVDKLFAEMSPYDYLFDPEGEYEKAFEEIIKDKQVQLLSTTYHQLFNKSISPDVDYTILRHLFRKAAKYRIRNLAPLALDNFEKLLPVIREVVIYLNGVINEQLLADYQDRFVSIVSSHYMRLPFVNIWISHLLRNPSFNKINIPTNYDQILSTRGKALVALRREDSTWVRGFRDNIDALGPWDKRAVLYSSSVLSLDEMTAWVRAVAASGDIIDKSIASYLIAKKKTPHGRGR